jgi:YVTN family beta-propeller protein
MGSRKTYTVSIFTITSLAVLLLMNFSLLDNLHVDHLKKIMKYPVIINVAQFLDHISKYLVNSTFNIALANSDDRGLIEIKSKQVNPVLPKNSEVIGNWSVYTDPTNNFRLSYPPNWKKTVNGDNITFFLASVSNKLLPESINLNVLPSGNVPLSESASLEIIRLKQSKPDFKLVDFRYTTISKNPAYTLVYSYSEGTDMYKVLHTSILAAGKSYSFNFVSNLKTFGNYLSVANKVINSLGIEDSSGQPKIVSTDLPELSVARDPYDIVSDPITDNVYIVNFRSHSISVLDALTNKLLTEIKVGKFPLSISVNPDLGAVYVANSRSNSISVIDSSTNEVVKEIPVGVRPVAVTVDRTEKGIDSLAFAANLDSNSISVIDATRNEIYLPDLPVGKEPSDLAVNEVLNRLYVANRGSNTVSVIDYYITNEGKFNNTNITTIKVQEYPSGIAINPMTNKIYVANYYSNTISVIDGASNGVIDTISVGTNPSSIAVNSATNMLYVTNYGSNTVSIIDGNSDELLKNIDVGSFPIKAYFNPRTDIISVLNIGTQTVSEIKDTSLLAGVTFDVNPSRSGSLDCNGKTISDFDYERYNVGTEVVCRAKPTSDYVFRSWSTDLPIKSGVSPTTSFNSTQYGNVTANFQVPVEVTLPKAYWEQLYLVLISILVPAVVAWSIPAIVGYFNSLKQRKALRSIMEKIMQINNDIREEKQRRSALEDIKSDIIKKLTQGKISETQYDIINNKISEHISEADENDKVP